MTASPTLLDTTVGELADLLEVAQTADREAIHAAVAATCPDLDPPDVARLVAELRQLVTHQPIAIGHGHQIALWPRAETPAASGETA